MNKNVAGYQITDHIAIEGERLALGHNPNAPAPYAVWKTNEDMSQFYFGHYFAHKHAAIADMVMRATYELERPDGIPLSVDFLVENARNAVEMQYIEQKAAEAIQETLEDILDEYTTDLTAEEIMQNPKFFDQAQNGYFNIDHSDENFALRQTIRDILDENPEIVNPEPVKKPLDQQIQSAQQKQIQESSQTEREQQSER